MASERRSLNHNQRGALGTAAIALIAAALFYIPWRVESTGDIAYAPFYRNPVMGQHTRMEQTIESRFIRLKGRPIWWLYGLQLVGIAGAGFVAVRLLEKPDEQ